VQNSIRLNFIVEGTTEEIFVRDVLKEPFAEKHIFVSARRVETSRKQLRNVDYYKPGKQVRIYRGGVQNFEKVRRDINRWLTEDKSAYLTTMFDLYALPNDFPRFDEAMRKSNPYEKVRVIEEGFRKEINNSNFIPYIQLHEFEGLLFSNIEVIDEVMRPYQDRSQLDKLRDIRSQFATPEDINDGAETAPSKRLLNLYNFYNKDVFGSRIAKRIGIDNISNECKHFNEWLVSLIGLALYR
jgi:acyl-CoA-binding protein